MIYLDTHILVWLCAGLMEKFNHDIQTILNENEILVSPIVGLELQYLYEIEKISKPANAILLDLNDRIGIEVCKKDFNAVINQALTLNWTRDPFDRIIVATASINNNILISKDNTIQQHYKYAMW